MRIGRSIPDTWRNFYTEEVKEKNKDYSTVSEFEFADKLNGYVRRYDLQAERALTPQKQYSKHDVQVIEYNYIILDAGKIICKIDVENKPSDPFDDFPFPPKRWPYWSFLDRKVSNPLFGDTDAYALIHGNNYDDIFWSSFVNIRANCKLIGHHRNNRYYRAPIKKQFVSTGLMNLANYIITLKLDGKHSSQSSSQKTLMDCI